MNVMRRTFVKSAYPALVAVLFVALYALVDAGRFKADVESGNVLRVAAPAFEWVESGLSPYGPGFEHELLNHFAEQSGVRLSVTRTATWEQAWSLLRSGKADMVLGLGSKAPADLLPQLVPGPAYATFKPVLVHSARRFGLRESCEVCSNPVLLTSNKALTRALTDSLAGRADADCTPSTKALADLDITPVLDSLSADQNRFALVDGGRFRLWQPFYQRVLPAADLDEDMAYRWYWRADAPLATTLAGFWKDMHGSDRLADLMDRYFGFLPDETDYYEIRHLAQTVREKMPEFRQVVAEASERYGIDPLLLTAVIYQESRFDPGAVSRTGVRGLLQLTSATAGDLGLTDRTDPHQSVMGGARYLRSLYDGLEGSGVNGWDRWFFALAAYNKGMGHVMDAVDLAKSLGGAGTSWRELRRTLPKLAWERWYKNARYGYTRGFEAVDYVQRIRYYYYVLHGLLVLSRPEAEQLAPLVFPATFTSI